MSTLDELFKDKLKDHTIAPPAQGWSRLESTLAKKNSQAWYRWAAVFLLGAVLTGLWIQKPDQPEPVAVQSQTPATTSPQNSVNTVTPIKKEQKPLIARPSKVVPAPVMQSATIETDEELTVVSLEEEVEPLTDLQEVAQPQQDEKGIVLEYSLEPVRTTSTVVASAPDDRKESSFMKVVDFAKGVKNGESTIGDLKEVKLELFAADHRKKTNAKNNE